MAMSTHIRDVIAQEKAQPGEIAVLLPSNHQARQWLEPLDRSQSPNSSATSACDVPIALAAIAGLKTAVVVA